MYYSNNKYFEKLFPNLWKDKGTCHGHLIPDKKEPDIALYSIYFPIFAPSWYFVSITVNLILVQR